jgi:hypothetical protein
VNSIVTNGGMSQRIFFIKSDISSHLLATASTKTLLCSSRATHINADTCCDVYQGSPHYHNRGNFAVLHEIICAYGIKERTHYACGNSC